MKFFLNFFFCGIISFAAFSQEVLKPLRSNLNYYYTDLHAQKHQPYLGSALKTQSVSLQIPFIEDFYYADRSHFPSMNLWLDSNVYVNAGMPIAAPSIGVATFDGLDKFGYPYEPNFTNTQEPRPADTLTSRPINLFQSGAQLLQPSDSIGFSFYYQARGNGEPPEVGDSLLLDFYNPTAKEWINNVWFAKGNSNPNTNDTVFKRAFIWLDSLKFLKDSFQFRFRNKATTSGNFDHWHIDYVYLNKNRSKLADTTYNDLTFGAVPSTFLQNYSSMPYQQYKTSESAIKNSVRIKNNGAQSINMSYENVFYDQSNSQIHAYSGGADGNLEPFKTDGYSTFPQHANPSFGYTFAPMTDSTEYTIKHFLYRSVGSSPDFILNNDTVYQKQVFKNYYAFDDGSAEGGYYVNTLGNVKGRFALRFSVNNLDTLRAVRIYFDPASALNNAQLYNRFRLVVWADGGVIPNNIIYRDSVWLPKYYDSVFFKGVPEYKLTSKLVLAPGSYFIGIQQEITSGIAVGFDKNSDFHKNLYYDSGGGWTQSELPGSLMFRPVFGKYIPPPVSVLDNQITPLSNYLIYPNPSSDKIIINQPQHENFSYTLVNSIGKVVLEENITATEHLLSCTDLPNGLYILLLKQERKPVQQQKIIIQH